jgi:virginiamycin B lyase
MSQASQSRQASSGQPAAQSKGGCRRALIIIGVVLLGAALLGALGVYGVLPARDCAKVGAGAPAGSVSDYCFPPFAGPSHTIEGLAAGPDGNLWFTEADHIGRLTPAGTMTEFARPTHEDRPGAIVAGPGGNLWFVAQAAKALGRITPRGDVTQFPLPPGNGYPVGLAAGSDGAIWYTRMASLGVGGAGPPDTSVPGLIGRMSLDGSATEFTLPAAQSSLHPRELVAGPDGALWFDTGPAQGVIAGQSVIGRITTSGQVSTVYAPDARALVAIAALTVGPDHNLWFSQTSTSINAGEPGTAGSPMTLGAFGRLTPAGELTLFPVAIEVPAALAAGPDGNLWFGADLGTIGRLTTSGQVAFFRLPDTTAGISALAAGPGGAVWCTQTYGDNDLLNSLFWGTKIGRITV